MLMVYSVISVVQHGADCENNWELAKLAKLAVYLSYDDGMVWNRVKGR